jgi:hypothetical protein
MDGCRNIPDMQPVQARSGGVAVGAGRTSHQGMGLNAEQISSSGIAGNPPRTQDIRSMPNADQSPVTNSITDQALAGTVLSEFVGGQDVILLRPERCQSSVENFTSHGTSLDQRHESVARLMAGCGYRTAEGTLSDRLWQAPGRPKVDTSPSG